MPRFLSLAPTLVFAATAWASGCTSHSPGNGLPPPADTGPVDAGPFVPDPCKASLSQKAEVVVGQGQSFYMPISDGTTLVWEKGPQGGHHVWIALRMIGIRMQGTITTVDLDDIEKPDAPVTVNHSRLIYDYTKEEGGHCILPGLRMQLDNAGGVALADLQGHRVRVTASLKDPDGTVATGSHIIVVSGLLD